MPSECGGGVVSEAVERARNVGVVGDVGDGAEGYWDGRSFLVKWGSNGRSGKFQFNGGGGFNFNGGGGSWKRCDMVGELVLC
jgi:hypothetical protein